MDEKESLEKNVGSSPRRNDPVHVPSPVDLGVVRILISLDADPAVGRVSEELGEGPNSGVEARDTGGPDVDARGQGLRLRSRLGRMGEWVDGTRSAFVFLMKQAWVCKRSNTISTGNQLQGQKKSSMGAESHRLQTRPA